MHLTDTIVVDGKSIDISTITEDHQPYSMVRGWETCIFWDAPLSFRGHDSEVVHIQYNATGNDPADHHQAVIDALENGTLSIAKILEGRDW